MRVGMDCVDGKFVYSFRSIYENSNDLLALVY